MLHGPDYRFGDEYMKFLERSRERSVGQAVLSPIKSRLSLLSLLSLRLTCLAHGPALHVRLVCGSAWLCRRVVQASQRGGTPVGTDASKPRKSRRRSRSRTRQRKEKRWEEAEEMKARGRDGAGGMALPLPEAFAKLRGMGGRRKAERAPQC